MSQKKNPIEKLTLTKEGSESFFLNALCNGLGEIGSYGLELKCKKDEYQAAKKSIQDKLAKGTFIDMFGEVPPKNDTICYEEVLMEILRMGGKLSLKDNESGEPTKSISLKDVHSRVALTPLRHLMEYINDTGGDAITADVVLQTVFYKKVIFG